MIKRASLLVVVASLVATPVLAEDPIVPDQQMTPGAVDMTVTAPDICGHDWAVGNPVGSPPRKGGNLTYSKAARHTSAAVKQKAFAEYGIPKANRNGTNYEIDHRLPLSLGGRDVIEDLWPETRDRSVPMNAWVKDRLEYKVYVMLCPRDGSAATISLHDAQAAFLGDWRDAYAKYCPTINDCPVYADNDDEN